MVVPRKKVSRIDCSNGLCEVELTQGFIAIIDETDKALVETRAWYITKTGENVYGTARVEKGSSKRIKMHNLLLPECDYVDHRDGNGLNNRRSNLRCASSSENKSNQFKRTDSKHSKYKGVTRNLSGSKTKYRVQVGNHRAGKRVHVGYFYSEEEAARAYDKVARQLFGEFARLNFPNEGEESAIK